MASDLPRTGATAGQWPKFSHVAREELAHSQERLVTSAIHTSQRLGMAGPPTRVWSEVTCHRRDVGARAAPLPRWRSSSVSRAGHGAVLGSAANARPAQPPASVSWQAGRACPRTRAEQSTSVTISAAPVGGFWQQSHSEDRGPGVVVSSPEAAKNTGRLSFFDASPLPLCIVSISRGPASNPGPALQQPALRPHRRTAGSTRCQTAVMLTTLLVATVLRHAAEDLPGPAMTSRPQPRRQVQRRRTQPTRTCQLMLSWAASWSRGR
ncbi:uncharacterized protein CC84DRAFT_1226079 [Paraphaeosphaeria sporulosa]|uniref:Uncharacterized protein n=1 Tax=Paraphaeosphaeria sporulosa TaxID=1460663 RepID=A0A177CZ76_9PLEO|nr:uncharacterized protein CC84DRAFT_1226079 [Paraphaeosphaeria sporulosa]OAG12140.1 hypothetical protein CC84DRAFT_1226079 [Paraphaeosphaeria sporulosa]